MLPRHGARRKPAGVGEKAAAKGLVSQQRAADNDGIEAARTCRLCWRQHVHLMPFFLQRVSEHPRDAFSAASLRAPRSFPRYVTVTR